MVFEKFRNISPGDIGISSITLAELEYGVQKSSDSKKNHDALQKFITPLEIYEFDALAAFEYGIIRSSLEKKGHLIGPLDMLISAHAKCLNLILITNNEKEFKRVPGFKIENWAAL
jgi:tRNA(fMet)-specific endonuclease VapC